ncbi:hypothetical protein [Dyadobacter sp.]|uniref:hypothetical protein n=1 Tax=Dyadobacter sp. TaxID=1914288 RepID=UPI003F72AAB6
MMLQSWQNLTKSAGADRDKAGGEMRQLYERFNYSYLPFVHRVQPAANQARQPAFNGERVGEKYAILCKHLPHYDDAYSETWPIY